MTESALIIPVQYQPDEYARTPPVFRDIPDHLKALKLWIVFEIPPWKKGTDKPKKILRTPDGKGYPSKGFADRKEFGIFSEVEAACKNNPNFYPGLWLTDIPGLFCLDYDAHPKDGQPEVPPFNSYTEFSVYCGYHVLCYLPDGAKPTVPGVDCRKNSWVVLTGNTVRQRLSIRDLSNELCGEHGNDTISLVENSTPIRKPPVQLIANAESRHPEFKKIVTSGVANNFTYVMILSSCLIANKDFPNPKDPAQVEREVISLYDWATKRQALKAQDKERKKEDKKPANHPGCKIITKEVHDNLMTCHHNTAVALSLSSMYGCNAPDGGTLRYNPKSRMWYVWDGKRWAERDSPAVLGVAWDHVREMMVEAVRLNNQSLQKAILKSQSDGEIKGALTLLETKVLVEPDDMDKDNYLLNVQNGTIDLRTFACRDFNKKDLITKVCAVTYDESAKCPKWLAHLNLIFGGDKEMIRAFQIAKGYSLIGGQGENKMFILWGSGKNGKSVTESVISKILNDYSIAAASKTFYQRYNDDGPRPDIARLKGCRYITTSEGKASGKLDEGLIKQLTGGDPITARYLFGREFQFLPTGKLWLHTNHLPKIQDRDDGIWRRIYPIPFTQVIPEGTRVKDFDEVLIQEEGSGILNWLLEGCREYMKTKTLIYPKCVTDSLKQYKDAEDVLADFLGEYIIREGDSNHIIKRSELYTQYKNWGELNKEKLFSKSRFNHLIEERLGASVKNEEGYCWIGISLRTDAQTKI